MEAHIHLYKYISVIDVITFFKEVTIMTIVEDREINRWQLRHRCPQVETIVVAKWETWMMQEKEWDRRHVSRGKLYVSCVVMWTGTGEKKMWFLPGSSPIDQIVSIIHESCCVSYRDCPIILPVHLLADFLADLIVILCSSLIATLDYAITWIHRCLQLAIWY